MAREEIISLIWPEESGSEVTNDVIAKIESVGRSEFFAAAQSGLKPKCVAVVWQSEYADQPIVRLGGKTYTVYRTYERDDQRVELYLKDDIGGY